jgi:hypothetical protein
MKDSHDKRREAEVYEEKKRLAEMAWAHLVSVPTEVLCRNTIADTAWFLAEAMYDESKRRRPVE